MKKKQNWKWNVFYTLFFLGFCNVIAGWWGILGGIIFIVLWILAYVVVDSTKLLIKKYKESDERNEENEC